MPCALKLRAVCASLGVSALARTLISLISSAHVNSVWNVSSSAASIMGGVPSRISPFVPSTVIISPSLRMRPSGKVSLRFSNLEPYRRRPHDAGQTNSTPDHCRMAGHTSAFSQNGAWRRASHEYLRDWFRGAPKHRLRRARRWLGPPRR